MDQIHIKTPTKTKTFFCKNSLHNFYIILVHPNSFISAFYENFSIKKQTNQLDSFYSFLP